MKKIFSGFESSGKSLKLAMVAVDLVYRNSKWNEVTQRSRPIYSNMPFAPHFFEWATQKMGVDIQYWTNISDLILLEEADIICDEVGNYFDSRLWADLPLDARSWLSQGAKRGIEFYGGAQDFAQVDKAFRRLVQEGDLIHVRKLFGSRRPSATKPPVTRIFGVCMTQALSPLGYDEDKKKSIGGFPSFFFIRKAMCDIFDTNYKIVRSKPAPLRHIERICELNSCAITKVSHV